MGPTTGQDDENLVREAMSGVPEAFDGLVERYQDRVYGLIHRMVGDREKAMDLTQEVFLKAWRGLPGFGGQSAFYTWLYRIAHNVVVSAARGEASRPRLSSLDRPRPSEADEGRGLDVEDQAPRPSDRLLTEECRSLILAAIGDLPTDFREIIVLRDMQDHGYEEIAEFLDIPVGTVRSRLHRARMELKDRLRRVLDPTA